MGTYRSSASCFMTPFRYLLLPRYKASCLKSLPVADRRNVTMVNWQDKPGRQGKVGRRDGDLTPCTIKVSMTKGLNYLFREAVHSIFILSPFHRRASGFVRAQLCRQD